MKKKKMKRILLTPGPLNCSSRVKQAMLVDHGSRDHRFMTILQRVRTNLLRVHQLDPSTYTSILLPGSGTTAVEAVLASIQPRKIAVFSNGTYGVRMATIAQTYGLPAVHVPYASNVAITATEVLQTLTKHPDVSHIALVHHETTSGILNSVGQIQAALKDRPIQLIVDTMSSFGGMTLDFTPDFLISSANKCIESVPGCAFVLAKRHVLTETYQTPVRSLTGTLYPHWYNMETTGQFLYTPPTNVLCALDVALAELLVEGVEARQHRYRVYNNLFRSKLARLGIYPYLKTDAGHIITAFRYPTRDFDFHSFYTRLNTAGVVIYPGVTEGCFRIGNIGHLSLEDITFALDTIETVLQSMSPVPKLEVGVYDHMI